MVEEHERDSDSAIHQLQAMEDVTVVDKRIKSITVIMILVQFTGIGDSGLPGEPVLLVVTEDNDGDSVPAIILLLIMVVDPVQVQRKTLNHVTHITVQVIYIIL